MNTEILKELDVEVVSAKRSCQELTFAPVVGVELRVVLSMEDMEDIRHVRTTIPDLYIKIIKFFEDSNGL